MPSGNRCLDHGSSALTTCNTSVNERTIITFCRFDEAYSSFCFSNNNLYALSTIVSIFQENRKSVNFKIRKIFLWTMVEWSWNEESTYELLNTRFLNKNCSRIFFFFLFRQSSQVNKKSLLKIFRILKLMTIRVLKQWKIVEIVIKQILTELIRLIVLAIRERIISGTKIIDGNFPQFQLNDWLCSSVL